MAVALIPCKVKPCGWSEKSPPQGFLLSSRVALFQSTGFCAVVFFAPTLHEWANRQKTSPNEYGILRLFGRKVQFPIVIHRFLNSPNQPTD